jgi:hypothetical protein
MKRRIGLLFALLLALAGSAAAQGRTCTFDDLPTLAANNLGEIPGSYCGASWTAPNGNTPLYFTGSYSVRYGTLSANSQPNALYLPFGAAEFIGISFPAPVVLNGFWASGPSPTPCGASCGIQIQITLTLRGISVDTVTVALPGQGYTFISSGYSGQVDGVSINANSSFLGSGGIAIDDLTYNGTCSASIQPNTQQNFPTTGGTGTVAVTAGVGCPWTAASNNSWITVTTGASGVGTGTPQTVNYSVAANTDTGFRVGSLTIAGLSLPIQEAGVAQLQVQGITAPNGALGTSNVIGGQPVTFSGSGWQADGGPITISGVDISPNTFSPPSFSGNFQFPSIFPGSTSPPCTLQVTATQGSITKTVTLTGIYLGQVAVPDTGDTSLNAGDQICATAKYQITQQFFESELPVVRFGLFAVESETTDFGGSLFFISNPNSSVQFGDAGILVNSGATLSFPDASGNAITLQGHATAPIRSQVLQPLTGQSAVVTPGPSITNPVLGLEQVSGRLNQSGGVMLDNGGLYVNSDATIDGGLAGAGFLFAGGNIQVNGNMNLAALGGSSVETTVEINWGTLLFHTLPFTSEEAPGAVTVSSQTLSSFQFAAEGNIAFTGATPPSLTNVPGALKQVSVGADGTVWGINAQQQIYEYHSDPGWTNIPGALTQIAVGSGAAIWGINAQQQIYRWDAVHSAWVNVPGSLTQIAVGADGDVWGLNSQSSIYHYNVQTGLFSEVIGTLSQIVVGSSTAVYGLNPEGSIFRYNPLTGYFQWIGNSIGFTQVAAGVDGDVWAVENNTAYEYDVLHNSMDARPGAMIVQVAVGSGGSVLGVSPNGQVYQWDAGSQTWAQVPGTLSSIAVGANGAAWGVNASQQIFTTGQVTRGYQRLSWTPGSLTQISVGADGSTWGLNGQTVEYFNTGTQSFVPVSGAPPLAQISVGAGADVWGVDASGNIYQYSTTGSWNIIPGQLSFIQVGANGSVWGINANGQTYMFSNGGWVNIPGALKTLSVGGDGTVWGINAQQQIYRFNAATQSWVNVPGALAQISVGNANNIWGINAAQQVYFYNTSTQSWVNISGAYLTQISVGSDGTVWGVNAVGNLYQWAPSTQTFNFMGVGMSNVSTGNAAAAWALNNWGGIFSWF